MPLLIEGKTHAKCHPDLSDGVLERGSEILRHLGDESVESVDSGLTATIVDFEDLNEV